MMLAEDVKDSYYNGMMSSITTMTPSSMSSQKMSFIIIWNVTRVLVRPKNMTGGSNRPQFTQKAAFHLSPSLILRLLYPHQTSSLVK